MWAGNLHTIALGRLCLTIQQRVGRNEEQLCAVAAVATTDTFPRLSSPEPGNLQRKLGASEIGDQPEIQWVLGSLRVIVTVVAIGRLLAT